ncbi:16S rRNA (cytosine(967)-C(5))-methyltransferase RsmB [Konateibacter massiliensis]|uniref:16S rRNA (cytosine(967)-C(5))-methyltransferase RsmB n=1 Tax=Konateibacter massiliensis TaxID=2002841 RepID=UPI000C14C778|nr:16S rRNA (cytosine(967)-C(5))-methyltransferase RsmB [Konateibacter massiliensis]
MTKSVNERELILGILLEVTEREAYSHLIIRNVLDKYQYLDKQERAFITRVSEGTIENMILLDYIINSFSKVKTNKMKPVIRNILRMSVYQLKFMDSVPDSAVCNEAVKLAVKKGFHSLKGFVNGVLRNISRGLDEIEYPSEEKNREEYLSVLYSMPRWIVDKWLEEYDYTQVKSMLEGFFEKNGTTIRCNMSKISPEELKAALEKENITVASSKILNYAFEISDYNRINKIAAFEKGLFQVQDISSMLVVEAAGIREGNYVLDICAAPGGKSLHAADRLNGSGHVEARDLTENKIALIKENIDRSGFANITAKQFDARIYDETTKEKADVVIADLPCSGLGVIGKKTDIKYKMTPDKQKELVKLQREILHTAAEYVKPGGVLIYSTCTINKEENIDNVNWFIENHSFFAESIEKYISPALKCDTAEDGYIQLLPDNGETDGFFIARLKKEK